MKINTYLSLLLLMPVLAGTVFAGEGRVEISQADIAGGSYMIDESGSYVLTENLVVTNVATTCIFVDADNVSIDLNGFAIQGPGTNSGSGIMQMFVPTLRNGLSVRNGSLTGWSQPGQAAIYAPGRNNRFRNLSVTESSLGLYVGNGQLISSCTASGNYMGISAGEGSIISDCVSFQNEVFGISVGGGTVARCSASGNGFGISLSQGSVMTDCTVSGNSSNGIEVVDGGVVANCISANNGDAGIMVEDSSLVSGCTVAWNGDDGIYAGNDVSVLGCSATRNGDAGICVRRGGLVSGCVALTNNVDGIEIEEGDGRITGNTMSHNELSGIYAKPASGRTHIQNNTACYNDRRGFEISSPSNMVIKNIASENMFGTDPNYFFDDPNSHGPITSNETNTYECANFEL